MKSFWIYIILCSFALNQAMAQSGIGLINTEIKGALGTGRKILDSFKSDNVENKSTNKVLLPDTACNELAAYHPYPVKSGKFAHPMNPRKIDSIYKLKIFIKDLLAKALTRVFFFK